jgi:membrane-bound lytic murein transglycosylase F
MIDEGKKIVFALLLIFFFFWATFSVMVGFRNSKSVDNQIEEINKSGSIIVCGEADDFSFYTEKGNIKGFHYSLAKSFADYLGVKLTYIRENNFSERLKMLVSGKCDIITGAIPVTSSLKSKMDFSFPIYKSRLILVQKKVNIKNNIALDHLKLFNNPLNVLESSPFITRLHNLSSETGDSINIRELSLTGNEQLINFVSKGLIEYAACDEKIAKRYLDKFKNIDIYTALGFNQFIAWGVKKDNYELLVSINKFIEEYKKSSGFTELSKEYL